MSMENFKEENPIGIQLSEFTEKMSFFILCFLPLHIHPLLQKRQIPDGFTGKRRADLLHSPTGLCRFRTFRNPVGRQWILLILLCVFVKGLFFCWRRIFFRFRNRLGSFLRWSGPMPNFRGAKNIHIQQSVFDIRLNQDRLVQLILKPKIRSPP